MTQVRLDQVAFCTLFEAPKNYDSPESSISISGSVAAGDTSVFSANIPYSRSGTTAHVYLDGNGRRVLAGSGSRAAGSVYSYTSTEIFSVSVTYSPTDITVAISIFNNTGGTLSLTPQTIALTAVMYDMPIGPLS